MKEFRTTPAVLTLLLALAAQVASADATQAISNALQDLDDNNLDEHWYFTLSVTQDEERRLVTSDPSADKYSRRQLVSIDGETPGKKQLQKFREEETKRIDEQDPDAAGFIYLVDMDTLKLVATEGDHAEFSFLPRVKVLEGSRDKLTGSLILNNQTALIERLDIRNTEKFSPAFSVTLESYRLTFWFGPEQGEQLLQKMDSVIAGKAGFLKSFDTQVNVQFSDFRRAHAQTMSADINAE